jgi:RNA polymerase sigma-70 factor (TIGR02943 family)
MENHAQQFEKWVELYTEALVGWAIKKVPDVETARDLVQDTFLAAFQSLERFKAESSPKTWLTGILKNKIADYYRKASRIPQQSFEESYQSSIDKSDDFNEMGHWRNMDMASTWSVDEELLDNKAFIHVLEHCMSELPKNWALIVHAKYLFEKDAEEICKEFNISKTNYWQVIHRAKLLLRSCIQTKWN